MGHRPTSSRKGDALPPELLELFSPLHKAAFGMAIGTTAALGVAAVTILHVIVQPTSSEAPNLVLLRQFFYGYSVSWQGALVGAFWAGVAGFVMGWFAAFVRNLAIAVWLFVVRARAALSQASDFLSHI